MSASGCFLFLRVHVDTPSAESPGGRPVIEIFPKGKPVLFDFRVSVPEIEQVFHGIVPCHPDLRYAPVIEIGDVRGLLCVAVESPVYRHAINFMQETLRFVPGLHCLPICLVPAAPLPFVHLPSLLPTGLQVHPPALRNHIRFA